MAGKARIRTALINFQHMPATWSTKGRGAKVWLDVGDLLSWGSDNVTGIQRVMACVATEFLRAYRQTAQGAAFLPEKTEDFRKLLDIFLVDKALYEILYELNARPGWVRIPLMGIMSLHL